MKPVKTRRFWASIVFLFTLFILFLSYYLQADPSGVGTHQQLGLAPCGLLSLTNVPCPMCGMTTTFSYSAHFQFIDGFKNQPFGTILFFATVFLFFLSLLLI